MKIRIIGIFIISCNGGFIVIKLMSMWDSFGTANNKIEIVEYRSEWVSAFNTESLRIFDACGESLVTIEHIGSTSVPGLAAKPLLDVMPGLPTCNELEKVIKPMINLGYEYLREYGIPGRYYFVLRHKGREVVHAHACSITDDNWARHLFFRDYLRQHPEVAAQYQALKLRLSRIYRYDRELYMEGKSNFIQSIERKRHDTHIE